MKGYIEERAMEIARYIIDNNGTVRQDAKKYGISKSTVHKDVTERLRQISPAPVSYTHLDDYSPTELDKILVSMCKNNDYTLDEEAAQKIHLYFEEQTTSKDENFANGRLVRNLYDDLVMNLSLIHISTGSVLSAGRCNGV